MAERGAGQVREIGVETAAGAEGEGIVGGRGGKRKRAKVRAARAARVASAAGTSGSAFAQGAPSVQCGCTEEAQCEVCRRARDRIARLYGHDLGRVGVDVVAQAGRDD